jgi:cytochrome c oxidase assembly protein subunit 15
MDPHRFAQLTTATAFVLIVAGGLVTSTGSGLAVPDWPLSYGQYFPPMKGGVVFEHGHRMIAGTVGVLTAILMIWIQLREPRRWVRRLALAAAGLIVMQAFLGGITVLYGLPPSVSVLHACLGQTIFCLLVALAETTSINWQEADYKIRGGSPLRVLCLMGVAAVFGQLVLGAILRHTGSMLWRHIAGAWVASFTLTWMSAWVLSSHTAPRVIRPAKLIMGMLTLQILLGAAAASLRVTASTQSPPSRVLFATAHVGTGALLLALSVVLALRLYRPRLS